MKFLESNYVYVLSALGVVTFLLSIYLGMIIVKVRNLKNARLLKQQLNERKKEKELAKRDAFLKESIITICRATVQKQCELSEACIRVKKLLENYPDIAAQKEFEVIQEMYTAIEEFPFLEARSALSKQERFVQDNKRFKIEEDFSEKMYNSLNLLLTKFENIA
jgi:hypothetical protein